MKNSKEPYVNKLMEILMAYKNEPSTQYPIGNATDEDGLMELYDQFSGLKSSLSDS